MFSQIKSVGVPNLLAFLEFSSTFWTLCGRSIQDLMLHQSWEACYTDETVQTTKRPAGQLVGKNSLLCKQEMGNYKWTLINRIFIIDSLSTLWLALR